MYLLASKRFEKLLKLLLSYERSTLFIGISKGNSVFNVLLLLLYSKLNLLVLTFKFG